MADYLNYVLSNPDLRENAEALGLTNAEMAEWGEWHFSSHGKNEDRQNTPTAITNTAGYTQTLGAEHYQGRDVEDVLQASVRSAAGGDFDESMWTARETIDPSWNLGQYTAEGWNLDPDNPYKTGILGDTLAVNTGIGQLVPTAAGNQSFLQDRYLDESIANDFPVGWTTPENTWSGPEQLGNYWDVLTNATRDDAGILGRVDPYDPNTAVGPSVSPGLRGGGNVRVGDPQPIGMQSSCFIDGVQVELSDGSEKNVSEISVGDVVKTEQGDGSVVKVFHSKAGKQKLYGFNDKEPFVTEAHPFMTQEGWKKVSELEVGDTLYRNGLGIDTVRSIEFKEIPEDTPVYNFHVDKQENYYADGYLVHNKTYPMGGPPNPTVPSFGYAGYKDWTRFMPTNFGLAEGAGRHYQPWVPQTPPGGYKPYYPRPPGVDISDPIGSFGPIGPTMPTMPTTPTTGVIPGSDKANDLANGRTHHDEMYDHNDMWVGAEGGGSAEANSEVYGSAGTPWQGIPGLNTIMTNQGYNPSYPGVTNPLAPGFSTSLAPGYDYSMGSTAGSTTGNRLADKARYMASLDDASARSWANMSNTQQQAQLNAMMQNMGAEGPAGGWGDAAVGGLADPGALEEGQGQWE